MMKLYRVTCRGMHGGFTVGSSHGIRYVVAETTDQAYACVRADLDRRDLGFKHERELERVELLAEDAEYPDCNTRLQIARGGCA
jgi:hypothetical protein